MKKDLYDITGEMQAPECSAIIDEFVEQYHQNKQKYEKLQKDAADVLSSALKDSGVLAAVTSRAKDEKSLKEKLEIRSRDKNYKTAEDIKNDIVDLVGLRIALYFPGDQKIADTIIRKFFAIDNIKHFPTEQSESELYKRRFSGYSAIHYRVFIKKPPHYTEIAGGTAMIEIQVASLLMHAWAEVEYDLSRKQKKGSASRDELESLDEINGLVIAAEIALQRLQRQSEQRIIKENKPFVNHYELAAFLFEKFGSDILIGDVETLFSLLKSIDRLSPVKIENDIKKISIDDPSPIADQLLDLNSYGNIKRNRYILESKTHKSKLDIADNRSIGEFLKCWISLETLIGRIFKQKGINTFRKDPLQLMRQNLILGDKDLNEFDFLRRVRNYLVHGVEIPDSAQLMAFSQRIMQLKSKIDKYAMKWNIA